MNKSTTKNQEKNELVEVTARIYIPVAARYKVSVKDPENLEEIQEALRKKGFGNYDSLNDISEHLDSCTFANAVERIEQDDVEVD